MVFESTWIKCQGQVTLPLAICGMCQRTGTCLKYAAQPDATSNVDTAMNHINQVRRWWCIPHNLGCTFQIYLWTYMVVKAVYGSDNLPRWDGLVPQCPRCSQSNHTPPRACLTPSLQDSVSAPAIDPFDSHIEMKWNSARWCNIIAQLGELIHRHTWVMWLAECWFITSGQPNPFLDPVARRCIGTRNMLHPTGTGMGITVSPEYVYINISR